MNCGNTISYVIRKGDNLFHLSKYFHTTVNAILALNPNIDPYDLTIGTAIIICPGENFVGSGHSNPPSCPNPQKQITLINDMRLAWEQHIYWTRLLLVSIAERLKDQEAVTNRLLQNPHDIADIFARFYSENTANHIARLLTQHLQIGSALITALRDGKTAEADTLTRQWYANADMMADAFSSINPFFNREELRQMLYKHLQLTTQEVTARLAGNYEADIDAFNRVEQEALSMADYFSSGIMRQFPQKFS
ncbi:MAG: LysM peptidoglycan-binding domain-containing protein [Oscillospiraceae bacterium]|nr:LysM peptidoglycan-binding domain-containing protein [Oscillospiraceae bacterium]